jgi:hypothetical protein
MAKKCKRLIAVLLCLIMAFGAVAVGGEGISDALRIISVKASADGNSITNKDFLEKLNVQKRLFKQNEYFCGNNNETTADSSKHVNLTESSPVRLCNYHYTEFTYCTAGCN